MGFRVFLYIGSFVGTKEVPRGWRDGALSEVGSPSSRSDLDAWNLQDIKDMWKVRRESISAPKERTGSLIYIYISTITYSREARKS